MDGFGGGGLKQISSWPEHYEPYQHYQRMAFSELWAGENKADFSVKNWTIMAMLNMAGNLGMKVDF